MVSADQRETFDEMMKGKQHLIMLSEREEDWTKEKFLGVFKPQSDYGVDEAPPAVHCPRARAHLQKVHA